MFDLKNHVHQHIDTKKEDEEEFDFWISHEAIDDENSSRDVASNNSPPLLRTRCASRSIESLPLLQRNYDQISQRICSEAIAEGRKELMEMIRNMPESSYELSLKDLVDEKQEVKQEEVEEASFRFYSKDESKKSTKKSKSFQKSAEMSRSGSMEKERFLIKMFIPSFNRKTKVKPEKQSRHCSSLWFDGSDDHINEGWSLKRLLVSGKAKDSRSRSNSSSGSSSQNTSRFCWQSKSTGCWSLICINKSKDSEYIH